MKVSITHKRNKPNTVNGDSITVSITYSSFDTSEIDAIQKHYDELYGYCSIFDTKENKDEESEVIENGSNN